MGDLVVIGEEEERMTMEEVRGEELEKMFVGENGSTKWEKFLPVTGIRILLVEADDSTRQIIGALLRNCNYKVTAVSDGLEAWKILKRKHSSIDLILMEVDLPSISGYALLSLIMEHNGCKHIPVVMMSSRDSIDTVFKCMSNGAADFLTKPLRKNELKNLWQHVWRKLTVNNGKEPRDRNSGRCKAHDTSRNNGINIPCSESSDNAYANKKRQSNEKVTDVQGLSPQRHKEATDIEVRAYRTDPVQVSYKEATDMIHNKMEQQHEKNVEQKDFSGAGACRKTYAPASLRLKRGESCTGRMTMVDSEAPEGCIAAMAGVALPEPSRVAIDLIGRIDNQQMCISTESSSDQEMSGLTFEPQLKLSLRGFEDKENKGIEEMVKLNHFNASALSQYGNKKLGSGFPSSPSICIDETNGEEYEIGIELASSENIPFSGGFRSKATALVGQSSYSRTEAFPSSQQGFVPQTFGGICVGYDALFPLTYGSEVVPEASYPALSLQKESSPFSASSSLQSDPGTLSSTPGCGQYNHKTTNLFSCQQPRKENKAFASLEKNQSTSSSVCNGLTGNHPNSNSGNRTMSDGTKESASPTTTMKKVVIEEGIKDDGIDSDVLKHDQVEREDSHHRAQREAALAKFRLKRKDRCYEKKVRYQSRKKLAEQRPRVKGQFVRQA